MAEVEQQHLQVSPTLKQISSYVSSTTDISSALDEHSNTQQNPQLQLLISSSSNSSNTTSTSSLSSSNKEDKLNDDQCSSNSENDLDHLNMPSKAIKQITDRRSINLNANDFGDFNLVEKNFCDDFKESDNMIEIDGHQQHDQTVNVNRVPEDVNCLLDFSEAVNENQNHSVSTNNTSMKNCEDIVFDSIFTNDNGKWLAKLLNLLLNVREQNRCPEFSENI